MIAIAIVVLMGIFFVTGWVIKRRDAAGKPNSAQPPTIVLFQLAKSRTPAICNPISKSCLS